MGAAMQRNLAIIIVMEQLGMYSSLTLTKSKAV